MLEPDADLPKSGARMKAPPKVWQGLLLFVAFASILAAVLFPMLQPPKSGGGPHATCRNNMENLAVAMRLYLKESKGVFPSADRWSTAIAKHIPRMPRCVHSKAKYTYAFNEELGGVRLDQVSAPESTVLFFEMDSDGPNPHGSAGDVAMHHRVGLFATADGVFRFSDPSKMNWRP